MGWTAKCIDPPRPLPLLFLVGEELYSPGALLTSIYTFPDIIASIRSRIRFTSFFPEREYVAYNIIKERALIAPYGKHLIAPLHLYLDQGDRWSSYSPEKQCDF